MQNCIGKNSRNNKIYEKQVASVIGNCKRKSNYEKGKFNTFRTQSLLKYVYSVHLPFRLELYQKKLYVLKTPGHSAVFFSFDVTN